MKRNPIRLPLATATGVLLLATSTAGRGSANRVQPPRSVRLYVFDCGTLHIKDTAERYRLKREELATTEMSVACFLIAHLMGTLIWDTGAVPDSAWTPTGHPATQHIILPDS